jgi:hypothetical protein
MIRNTVRECRTRIKALLRNSTEEHPKMCSPARLSVAAPRQEGRTLPVEMQTSSETVRGAAAGALRIARMWVRWIAVKLNSGRMAVEAIVPESRSGQTRVPSGVMIEGARQEIPATGDIKVCHLPEPAVVEVVEVAADAADKRPGTTQPILNGGNSRDVTDQ